jgi:hypothetical protein
VAARFHEGIVTLFLNGIPSASQTCEPKQLRTSHQPLYIGCRYVNPYSTPFVGLIDEVRLYNRALTDAEIQSLAAPLISQPK